MEKASESAEIPQTWVDPETGAYYHVNWLLEDLGIAHNQHSNVQSCLL